MKKNKEKVSTAIVVSSFEKRAKPTLKKINAFNKIDGTPSYAALVAHVHNLKEIDKEATEKQDSILGPLKIATDNTKSLFQPFFEKLEQAKDHAKSLMLKYEEGKEVKLAELNDKFRSGKVKKASTFAEKQSKIVEKVSGVSVRQLPELQIKNPGKIPKKYLVPDTKKIMEDLKKGKSIPGCVLKYKKSIAI